MRSCKSTGTEPTVPNYWDFCSKVKNSNYLFGQQMTFTFSDALMLFCNKIPMNSLEFIYEGKNKVLLFFGCNHPCYNKLIAHEKKSGSIKDS